MIKKLFGKRSAQPQSSESATSAAASAVSRSTPPQRDGAAKKKSKPPRNSKPAQPAWSRQEYQVPEVKDKTRFLDLDVHDNVLQALQKLGFDYCTPIQAQTLPYTLKGLDVIGKAQTGTGKTAAFLITIIDQLLSHPIDGERYLGEPRALIVAPTRELVQQIADDAKGLCKYSGLHIVSVVGGEPFEKQLKRLQNEYVDIIVATPGRLLDFIDRKHIYVDQVETLVLDEADRMLDMGFIPQVKQIVRNTPHKENRQTLLFSATFTQDIINLSKQWTLQAHEIAIEPEHVATDTVEQISYMVADQDKDRFLVRLLEQKIIKQAIVFANRRDQCQRLYDYLVRAKVPVAIMTGEIAQSKRTRTLSDFKLGKIQILIATDVVGRGIHIDGITHVINYNLPQEPENYVHRIGRTGRAGASGTAINLIGEEDAYELPALEALLGNKLEMQHPPQDLQN